MSRGYISRGERTHSEERGALVRRSGVDPRGGEFSETSNVLERGAPGTEQELFHLWRLLPQFDHYSYIFQGNAQVLDHILVTADLLHQQTDFDVVYMNSEFDTEQRSDHDVPLARVWVVGAGNDGRGGGGDDD